MCPEPTSRRLTLEIPERVYRALEGLAVREGRSPEAVGAAWLSDAIERRAHDPVADRDRIGIVWEGPQFQLHSYAQSIASSAPA